MTQNRVGTFPPILFLAISTVGLVMVPFVVLQPSLERFEFEWQRYFVGALFCAVCIFGVVAVFYPARCRDAFQHIPNQPTEAKQRLDRLPLEGHHPSCRNFSKNRITMNGRVFCAACSGLLVGAILAIIGAIAYFFAGPNVTWAGTWIIVIGEIGMAVGLAQVKVGGFVKMTFNAVFVAGSFITLFAVDATGRSLVADLYVLGLIVFFLWFRISLSDWNNSQTCHKCQSCFD